MLLLGLAATPALPPGWAAAFRDPVHPLCARPSGKQANETKTSPAAGKRGINACVQTPRGWGWGCFRPAHRAMTDFFSKSKSKKSDYLNMSGSSSAIAAKMFCWALLATPAAVIAPRRLRRRLLPRSGVENLAKSSAIHGSTHSGASCVNFNVSGRSRTNASILTVVSSSRRASLM